MAKLTLACVATDRTRPILDGRVRIDGVDEILPMPGEPEEIFRIALREQRFDITEMSMGSHLTVTARGEAAYIGVPVFPSRAFRHSGVFVRAGAGIERPEDLKGKRVGLPEYQQTAALWMRGILRDLHGLGLGDIAWRTGGQEQPRQGERIHIDPPPGVDLRPIGPDETLTGLLLSGGLDALISPRPPSCMSDPSLEGSSAPVRRLFPDYRAAEIDYHRRTGFFPIMHCMAVRKSLVEAHPGLPAALFRAFTAARDMALAELGMINVLRVALPWAASALEETRAVMGADIWPYGFGRNQKEVAAMARYAFEDGLTKRLVAPEELFHASTLELTA